MSEGLTGYVPSEEKKVKPAGVVETPDHLKGSSPKGEGFEPTEPWQVAQVGTVNLEPKGAGVAGSKTVLDGKPVAAMHYEQQNRLQPNSEEEPTKE